MRVAVVGVALALLVGGCTDPTPSPTVAQEEQEAASPSPSPSRVIETKQTTAAATLNNLTDTFLMPNVPRKLERRIERELITQRHVKTSLVRFADATKDGKGDVFLVVLEFEGDLAQSIDFREAYEQVIAERTGGTLRATEVNDNQLQYLTSPKTQGVLLWVGANVFVLVAAEPDEHETSLLRTATDIAS
jgi:hypothetical protein